MSTAMLPKDAAGTIQHAVLSRLKMRQLALLQAIDRHRALNRVANEMRLSQPAITKALRASPSASRRLEASVVSTMARI